MKKSILIIICLVTAFFFIGTNEVTAQWKVTVSWDDEECDCGTITEKTIFITIIYLLSTPPDTIVYNEEFDITNASSPYLATGPETINMDCEDCYFVYARVVYYDSGGDCCHGYESKTVDGQHLIDGYNHPTIHMY